MFARTALVLTALLLSVNPSYSEGILSDYTMTSWNEYDGLPTVRVMSLAQDLDGYIWIGTAAGLVRFDGVRFVPVATTEGYVSTGRVVAALASTRDGHIWAGFADVRGVARIDRGRTTTLYHDANGEDLGFISVLHEDVQSTLWAAGPSGLFRLRGDRWERATTQHSGTEHDFHRGAVLGMSNDVDGHLCVVTSEGVLQGGADGLRQPAIDACLELRPVKGSSAVAQEMSSVLGSPFSLLHDRRGNTWLGTRGRGLWRRSSNLGAGWDRITAAQTLSSDAVWSVLEDREGNIWVGTLAGLHKLTPRKFESIKTLGLVRVVETTPDGSAWVGTEHGLIRIRESGRLTYGPAEGLRGAVYALHSDRNGVMWVATRDTVLQLVGNRLTPVAMPPGTRFTRLSSLSSDSKGNLWIADFYQGVFRWTNGNLTRVPATTGEGQVAQLVYVDARDRVWIGFAPAALGEVKPDGTMRLYRREEGITGIVTALYEDGAGRLWIATDDSLMRLDADHFVKATSASNGIPSGVVSAIVEDNEGFLWIGAPSGLVRVHKSEFDKLAVEPFHELAYILYSTADGLDGTPLWIGTPGGARAWDGSLWFVTGSGVALVDPRKVPNEFEPVPVRIEGLRAGARAFEPDQRIELGSERSRIEIDFTALAFTSPTSVRFRYRLEGFDTAWVEAGSRNRQAVYTNLPPGSYRFRVMAIGRKGLQGASEASLSLTVVPRIYERTWFYGLCIVAAALATWGAWQLRARRLRAQFGLVLAERARVSREIHDTLLQGALGVALKFRSIEESAPSMPMLQERLAQVRRDLEEQISEARESVSHLRSPVLEMHGLGTALRQAGERIVRDTPFTFDFTLMGSWRRLNADVEENLFRIAVEAITNAVRHSGGTRVIVFLKYDPSEVILLITDDGTGFPHDLADEGHFGLLTMRERVIRIGGSFGILRNPDKGATVEVIVPNAA